MEDYGGRLLDGNNDHVVLITDQAPAIPEIRIALAKEEASAVCPNHDSGLFTIQAGLAGSPDIELQLYER